MLRRLATDYRELVAEAGGDIRALQHPHGSWSALECAAHVTDVFQGSGALLGRFLASESPDLDQVSIEAPRASANAAGHQAVLASLDVASEHLACIIENASPQDWRRVAVRGQRQTTAEDVAWEAVHEGTHHLVDARRAVDGERVDNGLPGVSSLAPVGRDDQRPAFQERAWVRRSIAGVASN